MSEANKHRSLRGAFGQFVTGVTVVTARSRTGQPIGLTANSFASVSLDPPLVSWCIDRASTRFEELFAADLYTISVLSQGQQHISDLFATRSWDDSVFAGISWYEGHHGVPQLPGASARFHCQAQHRYEGGDHVIIVGEVEEYENDPQAPLVFFQGDYQVIDNGQMNE